MRKKKESSHDHECDKPEIRNSFKGGKCSEEQIIKCHGKSSLNLNKTNV